MIIYDEDKLIHNIYGDIASHGLTPPPDYFLDHAIIAPRNVDVWETNAKILEKMPGNEITYHSTDSFRIEDEDWLSTNAPTKPGPMEGFM